MDGKKDTTKDTTEEFTQLYQLLDRIRTHLDLEGLEDPDLQELLDTVRTVSHSVTHAAGPIAAFVAGYVCARKGGSAAATSAALTSIREWISANE